VPLGSEYLAVAAAVLVYYTAAQGRDLVPPEALAAFMAYFLVM
jgi:hypothetical protein